MAEANRPTRAEETRRERRRKPGSTVVSGLKLHVDEDRKDPNYVYRWVNDVPGRVQQFEANDWDRAEMAGNSDGAGTVPTKHVGTEDGRPVHAVLMRKYRDWYENDRKEQRRSLNEVDEAIKRGVAHEKTEPELSGAVAYTPGGSNTISR